MGNPEFIIVSPTGRTGSTFLYKSLNQHPAIKCYGEIFNSDHPDPIDRIYFNSKDNKINFLNQNFNKQGCYGYKLLFSQSVGLNQFNAKKIIISDRRDIFESFISKELANRDKAWAWNQYKQEKIKLNKGNLINHIQYTLNSRNHIKNMITSPYIEVWYEDLISNWKQEITKIQDFLEVDRQELKPLLRKQSTQPLLSYLENPEEIKKCIKYYAILRMP
jgi:hypothetical protein